MLVTINQFIRLIQRFIKTSDTVVLSISALVILSIFSYGFNRFSVVSNEGTNFYVPNTTTHSTHYHSTLPSSLPKINKDKIIKPSKDITDDDTNIKSSENELNVDDDLKEMDDDEKETKNNDLKEMDDDSISNNGEIIKNATGEIIKPSSTPTFIPSSTSTATPTPSLTPSPSPEPEEILTKWEQTLRNGTVGCALYEVLASEKIPGEKDYLYYNALDELCRSSYKDQLQATVVPEYLDQFLLLSKGTGIFEDAFVTFMHGEKYTELAMYSVKSVHEFSKKPVLAFLTSPSVVHAQRLWGGVANNPQLVIFEMPVGSLHPWFDKLRAILMSPVKHGVIIESDTMISPHAERFFKILGAYEGDLPILPGHPDERLPDCGNYQGHKTCVNTFPYPLHKRTMSYVHAHVTWTNKCRDFLASVVEGCIFGNQGLDCGSDESALNYALWNRGATLQYCVVDPCSVFLPFWEANNWSPLPPDRSYPWRGRTIAYMLVHGAKTIPDAAAAFEKTKQIKDHPYISHAGQWTNDPTIPTIDNCLL